MTTFLPRKRFPLHTALLTVLVCFMVALGGCATPTTTATRMKEFSNATLAVTTQVGNVYVLANTANQKSELTQQINSYTPKKYTDIFTILQPSELTSTGIELRQKLLLGLQTYAALLYDIMDNEPLNNFDADMKTIGSNLDGIAKSDVFSSLKLPSNITGSQIATAIASVGNWLINIRRRQEVEDNISKMVEPIKLITKFLREDIGECSSGFSDDKRYYCLEQSSSGTSSSGATSPTPRQFDTKTPGKGFGETYCKIFSNYAFATATYVNYVMLHGKDAQKNENKAAAGSTPTTGIPTGDNRKLAEAYLSLNPKFNTACIFLENVNKALEAYVAAHDDLAQAFQKKSDSLRDKITKVTQATDAAKEFYDTAKTL